MIEGSQHVLEKFVRRSKGTKSLSIVIIRDASISTSSTASSPKASIYELIQGKQIRLLTVFPGARGSKMCCSLTTVTLSGEDTLIMRHSPMFGEIHDFLV
jgi:hypothetical protein